MDQAHVIETTKSWLEKIVIGLNLCPFAEEPYRNNQIEIICNQEFDEDELREAFLDRVEKFISEDPNKVSTTLWVLPKVKTKFVDFNDFVGSCEILLQQVGLEGVVQLVAFHPKFHFAGEEQNARGNFVNRSPYPLIHFLRVEDFKNANIEFTQGQSIAENNKRKLENMSDEEFNELFAAYHLI